MKTATQNSTMKTAENHFESAVIIIAPTGEAYDTGTCTFHDDDKIAVEVPDNWIIAHRYGDGRDDDDLPQGVRFVSRKRIEELGAKVTISN
jgi:hypothetical protein